MALWMDGMCVLATEAIAVMLFSFSDVVGCFWAADLGHGNSKAYTMMGTEDDNCCAPYYANVTLGNTMVVLMVLKLHVIDCGIADVKSILSFNLPAGLQFCLIGVIVMFVLVLFFAAVKDYDKESKTHFVAYLIFFGGAIISFCGWYAALRKITFDNNEPRVATIAGEDDFGDLAEAVDST